MPLRHSVSKVRHMTGSRWALAWLSLDLWVTSHSNREPSSYPATRRGPGPESGCKWGRMIRKRKSDSKMGRENTKSSVRYDVRWELCSKSHRNRCVVLEAERSRGYHPGSSRWHSERRCGLHSSACCSLFPALHYTTPHFAPHLYYWATGLAAATDTYSQVTDCKTYRHLKRKFISHCLCSICELFWSFISILTTVCILYFYCYT